MSTPTCSIFLPRNCLASYRGGKYLLAANGPFVELFDMDKLRYGIYDANRESPTKTRVTERSTICHILPLEKTGHVVVITSDTRHKCRTLTAHLVHENIIMNGGYLLDASSYVLSMEDDIRYGDTRAEVISESDEFVLATSTSIVHVRCIFSSNGEAQIFKDVFNLKSSLVSRPGVHIIPSSISPSIPIKIFLKTEDSELSLFFPVHSEFKTAECVPNDDSSTVQIILPNLNLGISCGDKFVTLLTTSANKRGGSGYKHFRKIARFANPYPSPKKICAWEHKEYDAALVVIISEYGISTWTCENGKMTNITALNGPEWTGKEWRNTSALHSNNRIFDECTSDLCGIIDGVIIPDAKSGEFACDLVVSRKAGALVVLSILNPAVVPTEIRTMSLDKCTISVESIIPYWELENDVVSSAGRMFAANGGRLAMVDLQQCAVALISKDLENGRVISSIADEFEAISVCYSPTKFTIFRSTRNNQFGGEHKIELPSCLISNTYIAFFGGSRMIVVELLTKVDQVGQHTSQSNILFNDFIDGEEITTFHAQKIPSRNMTVGVFGTSIGRIFTSPLSSQRFETAVEVKRVRMYEKIIEMKVKNKSGKLMVLGKKGQILLMTIDALDIDGHPVESIQLKSVKKLEILGFMTIMTKRFEDRKDVIVVKDEQNIALHDLPYLRQILRIPLANLANPSYFAHYIGDPKKNRIRMYVNGGPSIPPKVIRIDGQINSTIVNLTDSTTLSHLHPFSTSSRNLFVLSSMRSQYVVSIGSVAIECMKMDRKGTLSRIGRGEVIGSELETMKVTCSDVKFISKENSAYVVIGGETGEVYMRIIDQMLTCKLDRLMHVEDSKVMSIRYFQDEFSGNSLSHYAVLTSSKIRVFTVQYSNISVEVSLPTVKNLYDHEISKGIEWKDYHMLTMGDGKVVHDVWLLSDNSVYLCIGRNQKKRKPVELKLVEWKGKITATCAMTTKRSLHDTYLDIITIAKGGRIGILAALHMDDNPADGILFAEWEIPPGSAVVGVHTELLNVSEIDSGHVLDVRLYVMKKKGSLHVYLGQVKVEGPQLSVDKMVEMSKISTSVHDPYQIAVSSISRSRKTPNVEPPKYVIVSGSGGTQVVSICSKKIGGNDLKDKSNNEIVIRNTVHDIDLD